VALFPNSAVKLRKKAIILALRRHLLRMLADERARNSALVERNSFCGILSKRATGSSSGNAVFSRSSSHDHRVPAGRTSGRKLSCQLAVETLAEMSSSASKPVPLRRSKSWLSSKMLSKGAPHSLDVDLKVRSSAVELALMTHDKQISQSEWKSAGGQHGGGGHATSEMAH
jgi:hypothetical protein